ncbi:hypothetical protein [Erysipelothrix tonsillarum]|uniref:hypothetical protein n=1 Tax=Erysipelothrix tonsillarum TaxID=38402 RepID=UPI0039E19BB2
MTWAQDFTKSLGFVTAFLIALLMINLIVGDGPTITFLWLVLFSMLIINYQDFIDLMGRFSSV